MDEIIIIRAADPDGSVFQAVMDMLNGKRAEVVSIAAPVAPVLRIRELEIYHKHRRVFMAGKEVHLNHGEYTMLWRRNPGIRHTSRRWWGWTIK